ncbi:MAG: hypothetical protein ABL955_02910 [Elusimicrobiota bacterium]
MTFSSSTDQGVKTFTSFAQLKKAGSRSLRAYETANPSSVHTEIVDPLTTIIVNPAAPSSMKAAPLADLNVSAGQTSVPGNKAITGQLTDAFDNPITAGTSVYIEVVSVFGSTGTLALDLVNVGAATSVVTDAFGRVGVTPQIFYFVSSQAGDYARVWVGTTPAVSNLTPHILAQKNITGAMTTIGGLPTNFVFSSTPTAALVGVGAPGAGGQYIVQRKDDFGNITREGLSILLLDLDAADKSVHTARGYTLGISGATLGQGYGFRNAADSIFINSINIADGETGAETPFIFQSKMSSYSGPGPSSNTAEGGRPGLWTIRISKPGPVQVLSHQLRMDPDIPSKVDFANPQNTEAAGRVVGFGFPLARFTVQLQDVFGNPVVSTRNYVVNLSTSQRSPSKYNDYVGFARSSDSIPGTRTSAPAFLASTTTLDIPLGQYYATFYYLDTTASNNYDLSSGTKPIVQIQTAGLFSAGQGVFIQPDSIDRVAISTGAGQTLLAGTTSSLLVVESRDYYGNAAPLRTGEDLGLGYVQIKLVTDSAGQVQFSTPATGSFVSSAAVAYLLVNRSSASFYMIVTLLTVGAASHTVGAAGITYPTWEPGYATYGVNPGPPAQIGWATPPRRMIAGTTVQYELGVPTNTVIAAQLLDQFGNVTSTSSTFVIRYNSILTQDIYGGIDQSAVIVATAPSGFWTPLFGNQVVVTIPGGAGLSQAPFYLWGRLAGGATVQAQAEFNSSSVFPMITQVHQITPGRATYITVNHPYTAANPLKVGGTGLLSIKARDLFGNVATGDPFNGNNYSGAVNFASSGSTTTVVLLDLISGGTYHHFTPSDAASFVNLGLVDTVIETLKVSVTDYITPTLFGFTNDGARLGLPGDLALRSDGDVVLAGVLVTPTDFAPESNPPPNGPIPSAKVSLGVTKRTLNQGDGNIPTSPDPIPMLRMDLRVFPAGQPLIAELQSLKVERRPEGNFDPRKVTEVALWLDDPAAQNGRFDPVTDMFVATATFNCNPGPCDSWLFGASGGQTALNLLPPPVLGNMTVNSAQSKFLFVTVKISTVSPGDPPPSFGLQIANPNDITLDPTSQVGIAANNFPIKTSTSSVEREPAQINVSTETFDINAWWQPPFLALSSYNYVNQGTLNTGVMQLKMWTDGFTGAISKITVNHSGTGLDTAISKVKLYLDTQSDQVTTPGDGIFNFSIDRLVAAATFPVGETRLAAINIPNPTGVNGTVDIATRTYFLVYDYDPSAEPGQTHGISLSAANIVPLFGNGVVKSFNPIASTQVVIMATPDQVVLTDWNRQGLSTSSVATDAIPSKVSQNDKSQPVAKITLRVNSGAAEWSGLKLDRWVPSTMLSGGPYNSLLALNNKASDVTNIKVWLDQDGDGLLSVSSDSQVSPLNAVLHNFPSVPLAITVYATGPVTGATITVTGIANMFPSDNPFTADQETRLVLNDDQTDELLKEVVYCHVLDLAGNRFTNCDRAQEGTVQRDYASGVMLSGPARIPIQSLIGGGGQTIDTGKKDYFVTFDINPLGTVSPQANIGIAIPTTSYFKITSPKTMSTLNVGVQPPGRTISFVPNLAEYPDLVRISAIDAVDGSLGAFLQQKSTVAVGVISSIQTNVADASWRWILIYATGTATQGGSIAGDVDETLVRRQQRRYLQPGQRRASRQRNVRQLPGPAPRVADQSVPEY